ncbi:MAG TPA: hypothetical protein VK681_12530 [Reyranella sp.]|jgi:hypothetical protein|nr:hypothetical protein [Reyranella sp.]
MAAPKRRIKELPVFQVSTSRSAKGGCDLLAKDTTTSVFISKAGETKKTLLFKYFPPGVDTTPTIALLDDHTIQISLWRVPFILCRKDKWKTLTVKYDIGVVDDPFDGTDRDC